MTHPRDHLPVLDRIGVVLEATCDALMALQSIELVPGTAENSPGAEHVAHAISHLRHAVDELREAQAQGQTGLALGFVLARERRNSSGNSLPAQSSPRRTA